MKLLAAFTLLLAIPVGAQAQTGVIFYLCSDPRSGQQALTVTIDFDRHTINGQPASFTPIEMIQRDRVGTLIFDRVASSLTSIAEGRRYGPYPCVEATPR